MLTRDHSWVNMMVDEGKMTEDVAKKDKKAHYIVKCLGSSDFNKPTECQEPSVKTVTVPANSWLLACTDGLWNYAETPNELLKIANGALRSGSALDACKRYVDFALSSGGQDNVTVALAKI
jgi:serine/threonine protein phosphatase PrpC